MLSSTRRCLRFFKYHNLQFSNQTSTNKIQLRNYCQQIIKPINENIIKPESNLVHSNETTQKINVTSHTIDVDTFTLTPEEELKIKQYEQANEISVLEPCDQDLSHLKSILPATQTFARYANHSESLQKLVDLGMHLYKWEESDKAMQLLLNLDYEKQLKKYILFFHETVGVPLEDLGPMFTRCPFVLEEKIENMKARIEYLKSKKFTDGSIASIVARHPQWLKFRVEQIDERLGFFQQMFHLSGNEVRALCQHLPKVITKKKTWLLEMSFAVKAEMGFSSREMKKILLANPRLWTQDRTMVIHTFNFVHSDMAIPHSLILDFPAILTTRLHRLKSRHGFLRSLGRDQYDPSKEKYVSLRALVEGNDAEFCARVAKTGVETYNLFLKSVVNYY